MASNKTANLGLDIWAEMDYFKRAEVNSNFTKLDTQVAGKAQQTFVTTELAKKASLTKFDVVKKLNGIQRKDYKPFREYVYPTGFLGAFKPVKIFTDGKYYYTNFNKENFKNAGGTTRYVAKDGIWNNAGTTESPLPLYKAINDSVSGDTIILKKGIYFADNTGLANLPLTIDKNINLIGEDGTVLVFGKMPTWLLDNTTNLYKMSANNTYRVVDLNSLNYGFEFKKVNTLSECQSTSFSWYTDGSTVYINGYYLGSNIVALSEYDTIRINPTSQINVYMENFSIV